MSDSSNILPALWPDPKVTGSGLQVAGRFHNSCAQGGARGVGRDAAASKRLFG